VCTALLNEVGTQAVSSPQWWLALQYFDAETWRAEQIGRLAGVCARLEALWRNTLGGQLTIHRGGYFISFEHSHCEAWAAQLEAQGVLVRTYSSDISILRCGVPKNEPDWARLGKAIASLDTQIIQA